MQKSICQKWNESKLKEIYLTTHFNRLDFAHYMIYCAQEKKSIWNIQILPVKENLTFIISLNELLHVALKTLFFNIFMKCLRRQKTTIWKRKPLLCISTMPLCFVVMNLCRWKYMDYTYWTRTLLPSLEKHILTLFIADHLNQVETKLLLGPGS